MKKITIAIAIAAFIGCSSNNNCDAEKDAINKKYDEQIKYVKDNPGPNGVDTRQISLLNEERNKKLNEACD